MLPLFPLKIAVLPKEIIPLHIFEERYKKMITECINANSLFGMIYREKGEFSKIGCAVKIYKTLNKYEDGKYDILIEGCYRFRIINYMKKNDLWFADIKEIDEHYDLMDPKISKLLGDTKIDLFHYDSDKNYSGRDFAIKTLRNNFSPNSIIIFDDIQDNLHFKDFVKSENLQYTVIEFKGKYVGITGV